MNSDQRSEKTGRDDAVARPGEAPFDQAATLEIEPASGPAGRVPGEAARRTGSRKRRRGSGDRRPTRASRLPILIGGAVAAGYILLGLADGGFAAGVWAEATVLVWWTALVAALAGAWPQSGIPAAASIAGVALLALAALTGLSIEWASDLGAAYSDAVRALGYAGVFVLAAIACRAGMGTTMLAGTAVGIFVVAALALVSRLEPGFTGGPDEFIALDVSGGRLSFPLGYWNALGACMAIGIVLLVWLGAGARSRVLRSLAVAAVPVLVLTLFFSGSRGGAVATAAGLAVLLLAGPRRVTLASAAALGLGLSAPLVIYGGASSGLVNGLADPATARDGDELLFLTVAAMAVIAIIAFKRDRWLAGLHLPVLGARRVVTACVIVGVLGSLVVDPVDRLRALDAAPGETQLSAKEQRTRFATVGGSGRVQFWEAAVDAIESEPLRGIGAGGFEYWWNLERDLDLPVTHAHSLFLESAAEIGIGGALLVIVFFLSPVAAGVRRRLAPTAWADPLAARGGIGAALAVLAAGLLTAAVEWTWEIPVTFIPVVLAAAFLCVPSAGESAEARPARRRLRRVSFGLGFMLVSLGSVVAAGVLFLSERDLDEARSLSAAGKPRQALAAAREASDWTGFSARPYEQIALAERELGHLAKAERAIDDAQERADLDWSLWFNEAGIAFLDGRIGEGIYALNHAQALNRLAPQRLFVPPSALATEFFRKFAEKLGIEYDPR